MSRTIAAIPSALMWKPDILPGFEAATLDLPDAYDGPAVATLVRRLAPGPGDRAVL